MTGTAAVAGTRLELTSPRSAEVRLGGEVDVVASLEVPDPWLVLPELGRRVPTVDGHAIAGVAFETDGARDVPALVSGTASARDTRLDVHGPAGFPDAGAGRGVEVAIRAGAVEVRYGHLERGSARTGPVEAGEAIGRTGNTGRCADGCGRRFVAIELSGGRLARTFEELAVPIELEALLDGKSIGRARFPQGVLEARDLRIARTRAPRDSKGAKSFKLEVRVTRGTRPIASKIMDLRIRF